MFPKFHFIKGFFKNLTNPKISKLALISGRAVLDKTTVLQRGVKVKSSTIGRHTYVGAHTDVECATIGNFCSIADYCRIGMGRHALSWLSTSPIFTRKVNGCMEQWVEEDITEGPDKILDKKAYIGNDVWIGSHVLVNGGVHIGDGAVIGAGAVVVKDIPPYAVAVGVPAKVIKYRFDDETIEKLEELKWWEATDEELRENIHLFQSKTIDIEALKNVLGKTL